MTTNVESAIAILRYAIEVLSEEAVLRARDPAGSCGAQEDWTDARLAAVGRDIIALAEAARVVRRTL